MSRPGWLAAADAESTDRGSATATGSAQAGVVSRLRGPPRVATGKTVQQWGAAGGRWPAGPCSSLGRPGASGQRQRGSSWCGGRMSHCSTYAKSRYNNSPAHLGTRPGGRRPTSLKVMSWTPRTRRPSARTRAVWGLIQPGDPNKGMTSIEITRRTRASRAITRLTCPHALNAFGAGAPQSCERSSGSLRVCPSRCTLECFVRAPRAPRAMIGSRAPVPTGISKCPPQGTNTPRGRARPKCRPPLRSARRQCN
jgi:hypothetical protein